MLFTYLHLAPDQELTQALIESGATCLAYETVETADGHRPLLAPMSEIAGRLAPQAGAYFLERMSGGKGKLLGGATGVKAANVVILGAGIAGRNAAVIACRHGRAHQGPRHRRRRAAQPRAPAALPCRPCTATS